MTDELEEEQFEEKPFLEHLEDLRMTLFKIIVATILGAVVCLVLSTKLFDILKKPIGYSALTGLYARVVYGQTPMLAPPDAPSETDPAQGHQVKPSPLQPQPGTHVVVTGPLGAFVMLARDLFMFSREGLSLLNRRAGNKKQLPPPDPPTGVLASDGKYKNKVRVKWKASSGAASYSVWRSSSSGSALLIGETKDKSYDDKSAAVDATYYYWVKARNSGATSAFSSSDSGWRKGLPVVRIMETGPTKGFMVVIKTSLICGLGVTLPLNIFFLAQFVFPALTRKEKKYVRPSFLIGGVLFAIGLLFGYLLTLPLAIRIFVEINERYGIENVWRMSEYLGTVTKLLIANGIVFEMPLLLIVLVRIGVLSVRTLRKKRRHAIVIILFVAAMLTPMDAATMFMLAVPMVVMYEACIWVSWFLMRKKRQREQEQEEEEERESYWEERKRVRTAEKVEPEERKTEQPPDEQPPGESGPEQSDLESDQPPGEYREDYWGEDQSGTEESPDEGEPEQGGLESDSPPSDEGQKPEDDEENSEHWDD